MGGRSCTPKTSLAQNMVGPYAYILSRTSFISRLRYVISMISGAPPDSTNLRYTGVKEAPINSAFYFGTDPTVWLVARTDPAFEPFVLPISEGSPFLTTLLVLPWPKKCGFYLLPPLKTAGTWSFPSMRTFDETAGKYCYCFEPFALVRDTGRIEFFDAADYLLEFLYFTFFILAWVVVCYYCVV